VDLWTTQGRCPQAHRRNNRNNKSTKPVERCQQCVLDVSERLSSMSPVQRPTRGRGTHRVCGAAVRQSHRNPL
jgi:hypothetical protein